MKFSEMLMAKFRRKSFGNAITSRDKINIHMKLMGCMNMFKPIYTPKVLQPLDHIHIP